ncbi:GNAT family N-acetyltransferase [Nitrospira sp. M1]
MTDQRQEKIVIRDAVLSDIDYLVKFNTAMALETEGRSLDQTVLRAGVQAIFEQPSRGFYLIAEVQTEKSKPVVAGQLLITYEWSDWRNANFWWIQSVYVHQDWRQRGVFRALYQHVYEQVKVRRDVCGVRLYVEQDNATARSVYAKVGLELTPYRMLERDFMPPPKLGDSQHVP